MGTSPYLEFPLSPWLAALIVTLPGIVLFGWSVTRRLFADQLTARVAAVGVALGAWVIVTHVFGLLTRTLTGGLVPASVGLGAAGFWLWRRDRARPVPPLRRSRRELVELLVFAVALTVPMAIIAWRWAFHDELGLGGHQAMIAHLQNDHYPPRSLAFPQHPLGYHYGFNLLCAMLTALFRIRVTTAIDLATSCLWFYNVVAVWLLGERLIGRHAAPLVALVVLFGAGLPYTCGDSVVQTLAISTHFLAFCEEGGVLLNPGLTSYFFQHPWTLGLPLAFTILLIESEDGTSPSGNLQIATLVGAFAALYLAQVTVFLCFLGAVSASLALRRDAGSSKRRAAAVALLAVAGVLDVKLLGGFFAGNAANSSKLAFHLGIGNTAASTVWWTLKTFGLPLLGVVGLFWLPKRRVLFAGLAFGGVLIINTVRYQLSWDIVKFGTVAAIGLALPWSALLARLQGARSRMLRSWLPTCLLAGTVASSAAFVVTLTLGLPGIPWMYQQSEPQMTGDAQAAATLLRRRMPPDAVMYRRYDDCLAYAVYTGLPQVWINPGLAVDAALEPARSQLAATLPDAPAPYLEQHVRFFVLDAADAKLNRIADAWIANGQARLLGQFGALRVVELLPSPRAGAA